MDMNPRWINTCLAFCDLERAAARVWIEDDFRCLLTRYAPDPFSILFRFEAEFYTPIPPRLPTC